jgi:glycerol-3-phosphate dehydrogenase
LCVEIALAARAAGATILTHASVGRLDVRDGAVAGLEIADEHTGEVHYASTSLVLNTAGAVGG